MLVKRQEDTKNFKEEERATLKKVKEMEDDMDDEIIEDNDDEEEEDEPPVVKKKITKSKINKKIVVVDDEDDDESEEEDDDEDEPPVVKKKITKKIMKKEPIMDDEDDDESEEEDEPPVVKKKITKKKKPIVDDEEEESEEDELPVVKKKITKSKINKKVIDEDNDDIGDEIIEESEEEEEKPVVKKKITKSKINKKVIDDEESEDEEDESEEEDEPPVVKKKITKKKKPIVDDEESEDEEDESEEEDEKIKIKSDSNIISTMEVIEEMIENLPDDKDFPVLDLDIIYQIITIYQDTVYNLSINNKVELLGGIISSRINPEKVYSNPNPTEETVDIKTYKGMNIVRSLTIERPVMKDEDGNIVETENQQIYHGFYNKEDHTFSVFEIKDNNGKWIPLKKKEKFTFELNEKTKEPPYIAPHRNRNKKTK